MKTILSFKKKNVKPLLPAALIILFSLASFRVSAKPDSAYVTSKRQKNSFPLSVSGVPASLFVSNTDFQGVVRAVNDLQSDIQKVTHTKPEIYTSLPKTKTVVIIGTIGKNAIIDTLIKSKKLDVKNIAGKWETFLIQPVKNPLPGVKQALVIAGSDKRGTIFGIYDLSSQIGISPWYWWADVPVKVQKNLFVLPGRHSLGEPAVKYRGIFINDEAPALSGWAQEKFGGFNHQFYEKVFELILRMKGNYLWPAMWGNAFNDDDKLNPVLANEYGIVMGTSHHEPMLRAQQEWKRYGSGAWNYETNSKVLQDFWRKGIENMDSHESIVTVGMRGDGDMPMSESSNISLLEKIVADQRKIIAEVTGKPADKTPQLWALYKEVQEYYDKGMRVPDDVTLLLCDDNWGNIRKLPKLSAPPRSGGYGIYYHFDYVGGPRNYKWLNTNPISKVWEQMHLAHEYGANQIWIVNVGDIKPMEFPTQFFLDYAWNPEKWPAERLQKYTRQWAEQQFGAKYAADIADILSEYTKYNGRRKPELLAPDTYSLFNYQEAETIVSDYNQLADKAQKIYNQLPSQYKDAYYQLVLYPVLACANLNDMYVTIAKNRLYAKQGRAETNAMATKAKSLFSRDSALSYNYNKIMSGGKWNHMMDQTHIGYRYWQQPPRNSMPAVKTIDIPAKAEMGIAIEGSGKSWPEAKTQAVLPCLNSYQKNTSYIEVFNRGSQSFEYSVKAPGFISITPKKGRIEKQQKLIVNIDWTKAPAGKHQTPVTITGPDGSKVSIMVASENFGDIKPSAGFTETNGYISIEAEHFAKAINAADIEWKKIPDYGRTLSGMTVFPVTAKSQEPGGNNPHLEYQVNLQDTGRIKISAYLSPSLDFTNSHGLRYAVSIDNEKPQIVNINADNSDFVWGKHVGDNINIQTTEHIINKPGNHILKFWMVDPAVILQKIVISKAEIKPSYLGPPESFHQ